VLPGSRRSGAPRGVFIRSETAFHGGPARYSIPGGCIVITVGGNTEFAEMRAPYEALDARTKAEVKDLVCEHSHAWASPVMAGVTADAGRSR